ncbi:Serologically defined colon cancer antigen 3-like protein [Trichoplax sp. H2]|nr:Serologically defined colon cancer antigen 3-like protein [Trichoplax sp. H2]|eukprot:RDD45279.1 Serologically defined colon cancer antigen 3-like protein [Trichoplax sp. H2]
MEDSQYQIDDENQQNAEGLPSRANPFSFTNFVKSQQFVDETVSDSDSSHSKSHSMTIAQVLEEDLAADEKGEEVNPFSFEGTNKTTEMTKKKQKNKSKKASGSKLDIFSQDDDDVIKLRLENSNLKKKIAKITTERDESISQVSKLKENLKLIRMKDAEETAALEQVTEKIEQNLQIATKRATHAEAVVAELKKELIEVKANNAILKQQLHGMISAKENVQFASQQLHQIAENAKESVKKLLSDADALNLVAEILSSYDKFEIKS